MTLYFITGNKNKLAEFQSILPNIKQLDIDLPEIQEVDAKAIIQAKLEEARKTQKGEFIIEDTSLFIEGMNGLPGPLIKWFVQTLGLPGLSHLAIGFGSQATAKTFIGYSDGKNTHFFEGEVTGEIVEPIGETQFGWDPIFKPNGYKQTFAQMPQEEKNKISMRRQAINKLKEFLDKTI